MVKLKFKHPDKSESVKVLMKDYDIRHFVEEMTDRLVDKVDLIKKDDSYIYKLSNIWDGSSPFLLDCDPKLIYTVMWTFNKQKESHFDIIEALMGKDFDKDRIMTLPGGIKVYNTKSLSIMINSLAGTTIYSITTIVDIEKHPFMISLYREIRLGKFLGD